MTGAACAALVMLALKAATPGLSPAPTPTIAARPAVLSLPRSVLPAPTPVPALPRPLPVLPAPVPVLPAPVPVLPAPVPVLPRPPLVQAGPAVGVRCPVSPGRALSSIIAAPPGGTAAYFDRQCRTAYVAPPDRGTAKVVALTPTANASHCSELMGLGGLGLELATQAAQIESRVTAYVADFDRLQSDVARLEDAVADTGRERDEAQAALDAATDARRELDRAAEEAAAAHELCTLLEDETACAAERAAMEQARSALTSFFASVFEPARLRAESALAAFRTTYQEYTAALDALTDGLDAIIDLEQTLAEIQSRIGQIYDSYAKLEGATAELRYALPWDELLRGYRQRNPGRLVSWVPLPVSSAIFSAHARVGGTVSTAPAVLWAELPGQTRVAGSGGAVTVDIDDAASGRAVMAVGGEAAARLGLSLVGSCPFLGGAAPSGPGGASPATSLAAHVAANLSYRYQTLAPSSYALELDRSPRAATAKVALAPRTASAPLSPRAAQLAVLVEKEAEHQAYRKAADEGARKQQQAEAQRLALAAAPVTTIASAGASSKLALPPSASGSIASSPGNIAPPLTATLLPAPGPMALPMPSPLPQPLPLPLPLPTPDGEPWTWLRRTGTLAFVP